MDRALSVASYLYAEYLKKVSSDMSEMRMHKLMYFLQRESLIELAFGVGLFWEHIAPLVIDISDKVGCRYLYLFAADLTDNNMGNINRKLVDYYRINLKFQFDDTLYFIKPEYDRGCWCLCQSISDLNENKLWIWKQFVGDWE